MAPKLTLAPKLAFWLEPGGLQPVVHLNEPGGAGFTLCGYALEGNPDTDKDIAKLEAGAHAVEPTKPQLVTCESCVAIVRFCRTVSRRYVPDA